MVGFDVFKDLFQPKGLYDAIIFNVQCIIFLFAYFPCFFLKWAFIFETFFIPKSSNYSCSQFQQNQLLFKVVRLNILSEKILWTLSVQIIWVYAIYFYSEEKQDIFLIKIIVGEARIVGEGHIILILFCWMWSSLEIRERCEHGSWSKRATYNYK